MSPPLQALGVLHDECQSVKLKTQQKKLQASMKQLLQSVQTPCCPSYSAAGLLRALSHVNGQVRAATHLHIYIQSKQVKQQKCFLHMGLFFFSSSQSVLSTLLPVLDRLLEQSPDTPTLLHDEAQLMHLVLGKYNEVSAPLLATDQNCLDQFIRALKTSTQKHSNTPSCQIVALEQVSLT